MMTADSTPSAVWHRIQDTQWKEFHATWWGQWPKLQDSIENTKNIQLGQSKVTREFSSDSSDRSPEALYIRDELVELYGRISQLSEARNSGVVLTGQPGCGKTLSLIFFLLCHLAIRRPIMYTKALKTCYYFNSSGIWRARLSDLTSEDVPELDGHRMWSLIDSDLSQDEPSGEITRFAFAVHAVSPNESRYKRWRRQLNARRIFMNPWTMNDLLAWAQLDPQVKDYHLDYQQLQKLVDLCGPVPRDIAGELLGGSTTAVVSTYLRRLTAPDFRKQLGDFTIAPSESSQQLIIVWGHKIDGKEDDDFTTDFKSPHVAEQFYQTWRVLQAEEAFRFYWLCRGNADSSFLAGWVFESIAIHCTSGGLNQQNILLPLRRMSHTSDSQVHSDASQVPSPVPAGYDYVILQVTQEGAVFQRDNGKLISQVSPAVNPWSNTKRDIVYYGSVTEIAISQKLFYVPKAQNNNSLFDAFFLEIDHASKTTVVWILQMTSSKRHKSSANGYDLVQTLKRLLEGSNEEVTVVLTYVLVVPLMPCQVSWTLPVGWVETTADVYVQYLDMSKCSPTD
ncbi:hypothetical protein B0H17DRAFT_1083829 [Mycena rosella]|uniref:Uncharacterized protein n=1 Tax=Mycena rosella TaxID=1033263 RepID=A0AAD7D0M9_MYCRO|nr:hypothetical protein B0H17DRAFT_1083829 [Mycena rosella]